MNLRECLCKAETYPHETGNIETRETSTAIVFLTGNYAYKINKSIDIGFLDLSTLEKRKNHCYNELRLNLRISPGLYIDVVSITREAEGTKINGSGEVIEYAVRMRQEDPNSSMDLKLQRNEVQEPHIQELAKKTFEFHTNAESNQEISQFGSLENIKLNWNENFEQTEKHKHLVGYFEEIKHKIENFIIKNEELFHKRVVDGNIKHCHGDFHSANIFLTQNGPLIFDSLTFNKRFPCSDVISEVAFMAMDLDYFGRQDLSEVFVNEYQKLSGDEEIPSLLNFYKCYRAYIRAKIACFGLHEGLPHEEKIKIEGTAKEYFALAEEYAEKLEVENEEESPKIKIGIIGGSGLDDPDILQNSYDEEVETPYGETTSPLKVGKINDIDVVLLARHGRDHSIPPTQVNFRANIYALKELGCTHILATTACGSLREEIGRGDFVVLDQFIDFTRHRDITFHEEFVAGDIKHTPMATPFDEKLRELFIETASVLGLKCHPKGTVVTIEGPRFSTKAESHVFRSWGADVINMSLAPEAILANEIGIPYAAVAMSTDYDCWKEEEEPVTWEAVLEVFKENIEKVTSLLVKTIPKISGEEAVVEQKEFDLAGSIRTVPNWPKEGIMFKDITTLLENPAAFKETMKRLVTKYKNQGLTKIAGIDSRGFIFGAPLALELGLPFVLIRKKGKLPAETVGQEYMLEYGVDTIEIHKNSIVSGDQVLIVDDLIATGGTARAACDLVEKLGGHVAGLSFVIDLPDLKGKEKLAKYDVFSLLQFDGE